MKFSVVITIDRSDLYANGHGQRSKIKITGEKNLAVPGLFEFTDQTRTETNFIQHKWMQLPYQVYMHLVKILTLYSWYIMKYRHARRHPHSVENPRIYSVEYIVLRVQVKFACTVCWGVVGCDWGTTCVYFGIIHVCLILSRLPVYTVEPQYQHWDFLLLSNHANVSFEGHTKSLKKSCQFKIWMGFVGQILIKLRTFSIWGFL